MTPTIAVDWRHRAGCRGEDPELWTVADQDDTDQWYRNEKARDICRYRCPVNADCEAWAASVQPVGVIYAGREWGTAASEKTHPPGVCVWCLRTFTPANLDHRYCRRECQRAAWDQGDKPPVPRSLAACGTEPARRRHRGRGEACETCRITPDGLTVPLPHRQPGPCGTTGGFYRHRRLRETPCTPCRLARQEYERNRIAAARLARPKRSRPRIEHPCGTTQAYSAHVHRKERPCQPCRTAQAAHRRAQRAAEREQLAQIRAQARPDFPSDMGRRPAVLESATAGHPTPPTAAEAA